MYCTNCGHEIEPGDKFCEHCGKRQLYLTDEGESSHITSIEENHLDPVDTMDYVDNTQFDYKGNVTKIEKEKFPKKLFKGVKISGMFLGSGFLYSIFTILNFLFIAFSGLAMIGLAISLFSEGSVFWGLIALFIGTPIAIGLASYSFIFFLILGVIALIIWGIISIFGFEVSFSNVWADVWTFLIPLVIVVFGISVFLNSVKNGSVKSFIKENWFYIIIYLILLVSIF